MARRGAESRDAFVRLAGRDAGRVVEACVQQTRRTRQQHEHGNGPHKSPENGEPEHPASG
jgi:hypothetical protein